LIISFFLVGGAVPEMTDEVYSMNQAQLLTEKFANAAHYELRSFNQVQFTKKGKVF
jgi:hypothetical protein